MATSKKRDKEEVVVEESDSDDDSDGEVGGIPITGTMHENDEFEDEDDEDDSEDEAPASGTSSSSSSSSSDGSAGRKSAGDERLDITFEFQDPSSTYFHAVRTMLKDFLPQGRINMSDLSDTIVNKPEIGTIIVQEGGTDVFAFITAVNLGPHRENESLRQIREFLQAKCPGDKAALMTDLLSGTGSAGIGILVREHMMNLPPQLLPTMHESLCSDIDWAAENAENEAEEQDACFDKLIVVAPFSYVDQPGAAASGAEDGSSKKQKRAKTSGSAGGASGGAKLFDRFDDEIFVQASSWGFDFTGTTLRGTQLFHIAVVPMKAYRESVTSIRSLVSA